MVEIVTPICNTPEEAVSHLRKALNEINKIGENYNFTVVALGTHSFARKEETEITAKERYLKLLQELQILLRQFLIYGLHIHIGFPDSKSAINAYNMAINYLPVFLGFSTSSPFFYGEFTGLHSYRTKIFEQLPRAGIPEYFEDFFQFEELFFRLKKDGFIESIKDIWWDVRIHPDLGTVELRVCDSNPELDRIEFLAGLYQGLAMLSQEEKPYRFYYQINRQNKWNATRYSINGKYMDKDGTTTVSKKAYSIIDKMKKKGIFKELKIEDRMKKLEAVFRKKPVSEKMILVYKKTGDIRLVETVGFIR